MPVRDLLINVDFFKTYVARDTEKIEKETGASLSKCSPTFSAHKPVSVVWAQLYQRDIPSVDLLALESPSLRPAHWPGLSCHHAHLHSLRRCSMIIKSLYRSQIRIPYLLVTFPGRRRGMKLKGCFRNLDRSSMFEFVSWELLVLKNRATPISLCL